MASPESSNPSDYLILAINAGSSSLKLSLYTSSGHGHDPRELAVAEISGLSSPPASLKYTIHPKPTDKNSDVPEDITDPDAAFKFLLDKLIADTSLPRVTGHDSIAYACHRIVHGGDFGKVHVIDKSTFHALEELSDLAPLHNATGLKIVRTVHETLPKCTNMAYFDSAFHATIPKHIRAYAIDQKLAERNKLRKYGFHGVSYRFITNAVAEYLEKKTEEVNIIALHLGSGASGCCIQGGKSLDTTMGLTPVSGLPGGTRSGDIDPSLVFHYTHSAGRPSAASTKELHITNAEEILNKKSGFQAMTGTADFGKIIAGASTDPACQLALDLFIDRIIGFIGSYYVKLGGKVDALVFAGGIGEKGASFRKMIVEKVACLGFVVDDAKNDKPADETVADIGSGDARHRTLVCKTDEQFEMARGCAAEAEHFKRNQ